MVERIEKRKKKKRERGKRKREQRWLNARWPLSVVSVGWLRRQERPRPKGETGRSPVSEPLSSQWGNQHSGSHG